MVNKDDSIFLVKLKINLYNELFYGIHTFSGLCQKAYFPNPCTSCYLLPVLGGKKKSSQDHFSSSTKIFIKKGITFNSPSHQTHSTPNHTPQHRVQSLRAGRRHDDSSSSFLVRTYCSLHCLTHQRVWETALFAKNVISTSSLISRNIWNYSCPLLRTRQ